MWASYVQNMVQNHGMFYRYARVSTDDQQVLIAAASALIHPR